jgi:peptide/nickel transport system substrate-binding protein
MHDITRREFLRISALTAATSLAAACATPAPAAVPAEPAVQPGAPAAPAAPSTEGFKEAPEFAAQVESAALPPVDERLPLSPLIITPIEEVGQYGGTWRLVSLDDAMGWIRMANNVEPFLRWNLTATAHVPNLLETWEWNDDATALTVGLRKGIKWSDGTDLTADDYLFWWNDLVLDDRVPINNPVGTFVGGKMVEVSKVDDYTLSYQFAAANPLFLEYHSRGYGQSSWFIVPAHYMKQFHPEYNTAVTNDAIDDLLDHYNNRDHYPDMPVFAAYQIADFKSGEYAKFRRNPYYWKVDTEGQQLPYIDGLDVTIVANRELVIMMGTAGELDCQFRDFAVRDVPLLKENEEKGDYRVLMWKRGDFGWPALLLGYDYPDEEIVDLMYDKRFRQALSWAINRQRINDLVALGLAVPRQAALSSDSPEFQSPEGRAVFDEWAASYAELQPETAKQLLDEVGVVDANGDGWRERPNGKDLELIVDIVVTDPQCIDAMDLIKEDWESVGLKTTLNVIDGTVMGQRANEGQYMFWARGSNCAWGVVSAPPHWTPIEFTSYGIAPRIGLYFQTGGKSGIQPRPGSALEQLQLAYSEVISEVDPVEREKKLLQAYRIHIDDGPVNIGTIAEHPSPAVVKNNFRNVPDFGVPGPWDLGFPGTTAPEQYFIKA